MGMTVCIQGLSADVLFTYYRTALCSQRRGTGSGLRTSKRTIR